MLKGTDCATLGKPPSHRLFDAVKQDGTIAPEKLSPVLQRRLATLEPKNSTPPGPVINVTLGNDILGLARTAGSQNFPPHSIDNSNDLLLPANRLPGNDMPIVDFCTHYDLGDNILKKFQDNSFRKARSLRFVTIKDLKEMCFIHGEIADLRDAVEQWSTPIHT